MSRPPGEERVRSRSAARWHFELDLHPAQRDVFEDDARFKVIAAGRRFGKTLLSAAACIIAAASKPDAVVWWVSPSHTQSRIALRMVAKFIPEAHRDVNKTLGEITLSNGGRICFKSGDRPDNLRGEGLDLVVVDEAAFVSEEVWTQALRPTLSDRNGRAILISTFDGENWFFDLYNFACDPANKEWAGWKFVTADNPYIPGSEIQEAQRNLPKEVFEQEYMSSPLAFVGAVFDGDTVDEARKLSADLVIPSTSLCEAGLDWGWNVTALEVCAELDDGRIAWFEEHIYRKVELVKRCEAVAEVCGRLKVQTVYTDAAGASENVTLAKIFDQLGLDTFVQPVPFAVWKKPGIQTRHLYLERGREILAPTVHQLIVDTKAYKWDPTGEKPLKGNDHSVDAATAFYASRSDALGEVNEREVA